MNKILRYSFMALLAMICNISFAQTEFDFDTNGTTLLGLSGESSSDSQAGDITEAKTATVGDFSVTVSPAAEGASTANRIWNKSPTVAVLASVMSPA